MGLGSVWHWIVVLLIVVLVFGTGKLKNVGKDLGQAIRDFKENVNAPGDRDERDAGRAKVEAPGPGDDVAGNERGGREAASATGASSDPSGDSDKNAG